MPSEWPAAGTRVSGQSRHFTRLILLRWTLFLALALLLNSEAGAGALFGTGGAALAALAVSNMLLLLAGADFARAPGVQLALAATDTLISTIVIFSAEIGAAEVLFLFALVVLLVALGNDMKRMVAGTLAVAGVYAWAGVRHSDSSFDLIAPYLGRVTFLYCVALYFGYLVLDAREQRSENLRHERETHELHTILDILEAATSSLDLHRVMRTIVKKICEVVETDRCSVLFLDKHPDRGWVIASSDSPEVDMLSVNLEKYPEVRKAVSSRATVVVDDVETNPLMRDVREHLRSAQFNSLLVIPLIFQDETLGTLLLRAANRRNSFSTAEIRFCQTVAGASVTALKNALLYREMRLEADRHRSTAEKLKNVLENSMEIILTTDSDGKITEFNRSAESAFGYTREQLLGRSITELLGPEVERRDFLAKLRRQTVLSQPTPVRRADGNRLTLDLTFAVVRNDLGEMVGSVCVGKDPGRVH